jgi:hypothetical protein
MAAMSAPDDLRPGGSRRSPLSLVAVAMAGLGTIVDAASMPPRGSPLSPLLDAFTPARAAGYGPVVAAMPAAGFIAGLGLVWLRAWPLALLIGSVLTLPAAIEPLIQTTSAYPTVTYLAEAGAPMALVAVLAAAQELMSLGARGMGALVAGATAGAGLVGATLLGAGFLRLSRDLTALDAALAVLATSGGVVAVARLGIGSGPRPGLIATLAGVVAALSTFVPVVMTNERVSAILQVSAVSLLRRPYVLVAMIGLVTAGGAAVLAAFTGARAAAGAAVAALVQVGVIAGMILLLFALSFTPTSGLAFALAGLVLGCAAAATPWRAGLAAAGCVAAALALLLASAATGGAPEKVVTQARWVPAGLLLALLVATVTCSVAASAAAIVPRGGLPAVLGPIVAALVAGGANVLTLTQLNDGSPESSYLAGAHHIDSSVALLLIAALGVAAVGFAGHVRRWEAAPT